MHVRQRSSGIAQTCIGEEGSAPDYRQTRVTTSGFTVMHSVPEKFKLFKNVCSNLLKRNGLWKCTLRIPSSALVTIWECHLFKIEIIGKMNKIFQRICSLSHWLWFSLSWPIRLKEISFFVYILESCKILQSNWSKQWEPEREHILWTHF